MNEMLVSAMHAEPSTNVHRIVESGMRSEVRGSTYVGRGAHRIPGSGPLRTWKRSSHRFTEEGLVGDEPRIPADAIAYRNLVAAVMEGAVYEFRAVRAQSIRRGADLAHAQQVAKDSYVGRWIFGDGPKSFGFRWCCSVLGEMNPERVRSSLIELMDFPKKYAVKVKSSAQHKDNQWHTRAE